MELDPHFCPEEVMSREVEQVGRLLLRVVQVVRQQRCIVLVTLSSTAVE